MSRGVLQALFRPGTLLALEAELPDAELLRRFRADGDEGSFLEVVRRHGPMVWAVCRHSLSGQADAEDAFQATFLALVKSAKSIRAGASLPAWLHGVAVRVAARARRQAARRRQREGRSAVPEAEVPVPDSAWPELFRALQEEVGRLPEPLRTAYVLCELGGVRQPDAAKQLGWKPGTLSGRLTQARQRLLSQLTKRGLAPAVVAGLVAADGTAGGATLLTALAAGPVPRVVVEAVRLYVGAGAAAGTVGSVALHKLATGGVVMGLTRMKLAALAAFAAGGVGVGVGPALMPTTNAQGPGTEGGPAAATQLPTVRLKPATPNLPPPPAVKPEPPPKPPKTVKEVVTITNAPPKSKWEYKLVAPKAQGELAAQLAAESGDGWEFAAQVNGQLVFKRPTGGPIRPERRGATAPNSNDLLEHLRASVSEREARLARTREAMERMAKTPETLQLFMAELKHAEAELAAARTRLTEAEKRSAASPYLNLVQPTQPPAWPTLPPPTPAAPGFVILKPKHLDAMALANLIGSLAKTGIVGAKTQALAAPNGVGVIVVAEPKDVATLQELLKQLDVPAEGASRPVGPQQIPWVDPESGERIDPPPAASRIPSLPPRVEPVPERRDPAPPVEVDVIPPRIPDSRLPTQVPRSTPPPFELVPGVLRTQPPMDIRPAPVAPAKPAKRVSASFPLKHASADVVAQAIAAVFHDKELDLNVNVASNTLVVTGSQVDVDTVKALVPFLDAAPNPKPVPVLAPRPPLTTIPAIPGVVEPGTQVPRQPGVVAVSADAPFAVIRLAHAAAADVAQELGRNPVEGLALIKTVSKDILYVQGEKRAVEAAKKRVEELDTPPRPLVPTLPRRVGEPVPPLPPPTAPVVPTPAAPTPARP